MESPTSHDAQPKIHQLAQKAESKYQPSFTFFAIIIIPGIHKRRLLNINVQTSRHTAAAVRAASAFFSCMMFYSMNVGRSRVFDQLIHTEN